MWLSTIVHWGLHGAIRSSLTDLEMQVTWTMFQNALNAHEVAKCFGREHLMHWCFERDFGSRGRKRKEREGYRWRRAVLRRKKGCMLLSTDKLERGMRRLRMMDVKRESLMKMCKLETVLREKRITMKMETAEGELVVGRKDCEQEELRRPEENI